MPLPWNFNSAATPTLYHYTSGAAAQAMVENRSIWLSEYTAMNDASEFAYARGRLLALLRDHEVYIDMLARYCMVSALERLIEGTGLMIGSLTARRDDLGQWRIYAGNGAGCVLGIDAAPTSSTMPAWQSEQYCIARQRSIACFAPHSRS